ncbi:MAG: tetratricopeptide repeat protein [Gammaproteobacteria bacterium]|nr:MAG: tetratricopeptide repeat protein [Gammaproteobacteria bacterium]
MLTGLLYAADPGYCPRMQAPATDDDRFGFTHYLRSGLLHPSPYASLLVLAVWLFVAALIGGSAFHIARQAALPGLSLNVLAAGESSYRAGELVQARDEFLDAAGISPGNSSFLVNLGVAENALGNQLGAIDAFERAIRVKPDHAAANYYLGLLHLQRNEVDAAIYYLSQSIRFWSGPAGAPVYNDLGVAYKRKGDHEKAAQSFTRALEIDPALISAQSNLARLGQRAQ